MRPRGIMAVVLLTAGLSGCAALACAPATIIVTGKEERPMLRSEPRGLRTDELGRVKEARRDVIAPEYWVRDREGRWSRVSEAQWHASEPDRPLTVCR